MLERGTTEPRPVRQLLTVVVSRPSKAAKSRTERLMASCSATASKPVHARPLTIALPYDLPPDLDECVRRVNSTRPLRGRARQRPTGTFEPVPGTKPTPYRFGRRTGPGEPEPVAKALGIGYLHQSMFVSQGRCSAMLYATPAVPPPAAVTRPESHRAPEQPFTIGKAHAVMQFHIACRARRCRRKAAALQTLVAAGRVVSSAHRPR